MPRVSAIIASFMVYVQNQQNDIAHEALFQRADLTVKVAMELIMMVKRTQISMTWNGPVDRKDESVAL